METVLFERYLVEEVARWLLCVAQRQGRRRPEHHEASLGDGTLLPCQQQGHARRETTWSGLKLNGEARGPGTGRQGPRQRTIKLQLWPLLKLTSV